MSSNSNIEWTDASWNAITGCSRVSPECDNCYAVADAHRMASNPSALVRSRYAGLTVLNGVGDRHFNGTVRFHEDRLDLPLKWKAPKRIFVNSQSDMFHRYVPFDFIDKMRDRMRRTPHHTYQILTKRYARCAEYYSTREPLLNEWIGFSAGLQSSFDECVPHLVTIKARVRFLSIEPLLGHIDARYLLGGQVCSRCMQFQDVPGACHNCGFRVSKKPVHWVIVGGESGANARPCKIAWLRSIVRQCSAYGFTVPCFVKQLGRRFIIPNDSFSEWPRDGDVLIDNESENSVSYQGEDVECSVADKKGADWNDWPNDLCVRQFPEAA